MRLHDEQPVKASRITGDKLRPVVRLVTLTGLLRVRACRLCGALVVVDAELRHAAQHRADLGHNSV